MEKNHKEMYKRLYKSVPGGALIQASVILSSIISRYGKDDEELHSHLSDIQELLAIDLKKIQTISKRIAGESRLPEQIEKGAGLLLGTLKDLGWLPKKGKDESKV